jgi:hypothetical protein
MNTARYLSAALDSRARVHAAASTLAKHYPTIAMSVVERLDSMDNDQPEKLAGYAVEIESLQAAVVLGLATTPDGNNVSDKNLVARPKGLPDPTKAITTLVQGRN